MALVVGNGTAQLLVAAMYVLTARSMHPDEFGSIVTVIALGVVGAGFADLGANSYWIRELASRRLTQDELNVRVWTRFLVVLAAAVGVAVAAFFVSPMFIFTGVFLVSTSTVQTVLVPLRAAQRSESVGWLIVFGRAVAIAIFLVQTAAGVRPGLALLTSLPLGNLALVMCAYAVTSAPNRLGFCVRPWGNPWSGTKWFAVFTIGTSASKLDLPIVAALSGPGAAGIYGAVNRWTQPLAVAVAGFTSAAAPFIAAETRLIKLRAQLLRASWILVLTIALCLGVLATAPWLVTSLLGADFSDSAPVLQLLVMAIILNTFSQPLLVALQSRHFDHLTAVITALTVVVQLSITVVLSPRLGALGAGIGMLVGQFVALFGAVISIAVMARRRRSLS